MIGRIQSAVAIGFLVGAIWACSGAEEGEIQLPYGIEVVGGKIDEEGVVVVDFEEQSVGSSSALALQLQNVGVEEVALEVSRPEAPFLLGAVPRSIRGGERGELLFQFHPTEVGQFEGAAEVHYEGGSISIRLEGQAREEKVCELSAYRSSLRFTVAEDEPEFDRLGLVRVENIGDGRCVVSGLRIEGDPAFSLPSAGAFELMPNETRSIPVHFKPQDQAEAILVIEGDGFELGVPLGTKDANDCLGGDERIEAQGIVGGGCAPGRFEVTNNCDVALSFAFSSSPGFRMGGERRPMTLQAEASAGFELEFVPTESPWSREGDAVLHAENGDRVRWSLLGDLQWAEETFDTEPTQTRDLLIVLDVAESLTGYREKLERFALYIAELVHYERDIDFRHHVTTTSMQEGSCRGERGRLIPLDGARPTSVGWDTSDRENVLLENMKPPACQEGGGQGLAAIAAALGEDGWPPWRRGNLHVIVFSVEDDVSPESIAHYRAKFGQEIGGGHRYVDALHFRVPTEVCHEHAPAARYLSLDVNESAWPICWEEPLFATPQPFDAELSHRPVDLDGNGRFDEHDGIEVLIDEVPYPDLWYIRDGRVYLSQYPGHMPVLRGTKVGIRYPRACE